MNKTKKYIIVAIIAIVIVAAGAAGSVLLLHHANTPATDSSKQTTPTTNQNDADASITQADALYAKKDYDGAISAYQKAKEFYVGEKDTEKVARIDAQISLLEAEKKQTPAKSGLVGGQ